MLVIFAASCGLIVVVAFVMSARQAGRIPFSKALWLSGRNGYTKSNPRLRMVEAIEREVAARRESGNPMTKQQIVDMLGPPEPQVGVFDPKTGTVPPGFPTSDYTYVTGVNPKSLTRRRTLQTMHVVFGPNSKAAYVTTEEMDYPQGTKIVPAKIMALPKVPKPRFAPPSKSPKKTGP